MGDAAMCLPANLSDGSYKYLEVLKMDEDNKKTIKIKQATKKGFVESDSKFGNFLYEIDGEIYLIRIRKLTPRECWRLMDFNEGAFENAQNVLSDTRLYKCAGNSIVVNCLVAILGQLIPDKEEDYKGVLSNG